MKLKHLNADDLNWLHTDEALPDEDEWGIRCIECGRSGDHRTCNNNHPTCEDCIIDCVVGWAAVGISETKFSDILHSIDGQGMIPTNLCDGCNG